MSESNRWGIEMKFMEMTPKQAFPKRTCKEHGGKAKAGEPLVCCMY